MYECVLRCIGVHCTMGYIVIHYITLGLHGRAFGQMYEGVLRCIGVCKGVVRTRMYAYVRKVVYVGVSWCILGFRVTLNPNIHHETPFVPAVTLP
jgi:hypothetical protein